MKSVYLVLICLLLSGCGISSDQITATAVIAHDPTQTPAPINTPSRTPTPNIAATQYSIVGMTITAQVHNAGATLTEIVNFNSTFIANISTTLDEIKNTSGDVENFDISKAKLVLGPHNGRLVHDPGNLVVTYDPRLYLKNFIVSIKFINPHDTTAAGLWDYGILFRNKYSNDQYRLIILSNQTWTLLDGKTNDYIFSSKDKNLKSKAGEENTIWLVVFDKKAYLYINSEYIKSLNISTRLTPGDVSPATGLYYGNSKKQGATEYQDFRVWSLP